MALPKITQPEFEITLPVLQKKVKFRPFLVKEEKVLLVGKEGNAGEQLNAMINLLGDVVLSPKNFNARDLTVCDMEYLFMHLRAKSVNNLVKLKYKDNDDGDVYDFEINIDEVEPTIDPDRSKTFAAGDLMVEMRDPTIGIMEKAGVSMDGLKKEDANTDDMFKLLAHCLVQVTDKDSVYDDFTIQEAIDFLSSLDIKTFENIKVFFETAPTLTHDLEYVNKNGKDRKITLRGIQDFF